MRFLEFQEFHRTKHVLQVCPMEELTRPCLTLIFISPHSYGSLCQRDSVRVSVIRLNRWNCSDLQLLLYIQSLKLILTLQKTKSSTSFLTKSIQPMIFRDPGISDASIRAIFIRDPSIDETPSCCTYRARTFVRSLCQRGSVPMSITWLNR